MLTVMTFNGLSSDHQGLGIDYITHITGRYMLTETTDHLQAIPGMDGVVDHGRDRRPREITVTMIMKDADYDVKLERALKIAAWLDTATVKELKFSDDPNRRFWARRKGAVDPERLAILGRITVQFVVPGIDIESTHVKTFSPNNGTQAVPVEITAIVTSPTDYLRVILEQTGQFVLIDQNLSVGDEVVIDTQRRLATVNGIDARPNVHATSRYFKLPPGEFYVYADPDTVVLELVYRERWK